MGETKSAELSIHTSLDRLNDMHVFMSNSNRWPLEFAENYEICNLILDDFIADPNFSRYFSERFGRFTVPMVNRIMNESPHSMGDWSEMDPL